MAKDQTPPWVEADDKQMDEQYEQCIEAFDKLQSRLIKEGFHPAPVMKSLADLSINLNLMWGGEKLANQFIAHQRGIVQEWLKS
jgi:hypothetical protein